MLNNNNNNNNNNNIYLDTVVGIFWRQSCAKSRCSTNGTGSTGDRGPGTCGTRGIPSRHTASLATSPPCRRQLKYPKNITAMMRRRRLYHAYYPGRYKNRIIYVRIVASRARPIADCRADDDCWREPTLLARSDQSDPNLSRRQADDQPVWSLRQIVTKTKQFTIIIIILESLT